MAKLRRTPLLFEADDPPTLDDVRDGLIEKHKLSHLWLLHKPKQKRIEIINIGVHPDHRGQGHARAAMDALTAHADATGHSLALSPDSNYGASKKRLTQWYRSHGFVPNKGRNKDWGTRSTMVRRTEDI